MGKKYGKSCGMAKEICVKNMVVNIMSNPSVIYHYPYIIIIFKLCSYEITNLIKFYSSQSMNAHSIFPLPRFCFSSYNI